MAYKTSASLDKLICTDYVDFGKSQDRFGQFCWAKNDSKSFGCETRSFQNSWQQRVPNGTKSYNGRTRFQPLDAIEESDDHCSRKFS